jgi:AP-3 complex subunit beta
MLQQLLAGVVPGIGAADARDVGGVVLRRAQVRVVLFEGKADAGAAAAAAAHDDDGNNDDGARRVQERLGTLGLVLGRDVPNGRMLPDWLEHGVESSLRASPDDAPATPAAVTAIGHVATPGASTSRTGGVGSGGHSTPMVVLTPAGSGGPSPVGSVPNRSGWTDLEKFYASDSEEEEDEEDEEEEEGEDEDESEDEESEDQSGREEDDRATGAPRTSEEKDDGEEDEDEDEVGDVELDASSKMDPVR